MQKKPEEGRREERLERERETEEKKVAHWPGFSRVIKGGVKMFQQKKPRGGRKKTEAKPNSAGRKKQNGKETD